MWSLCHLDLSSNSSWLHSLHLASWPLRRLTISSTSYEDPQLPHSCFAIFPAKLPPGGGRAGAHMLRTWALSMKNMKPLSFPKLPSLLPPFSFWTHDLASYFRGNGSHQVRMQNFPLPYRYIYLYPHPFFSLSFKWSNNLLPLLGQL